MSPIWETVSGILVSVGGAGAIMWGIVKFAANRIADQLTIQYKNELDKEILKIKSDLENDRHSYQAKFDKEFNLYGKLMNSFYEMRRTVYWLFPSCLDVTPADDDKKKEIYEGRYTDAYEALSAAQLNLASNSIFMPDDIYKRFENILSLCRSQYNLYSSCGPLVKINGDLALSSTRDQCFNRTTIIQNEYESLVNYLREYIAKKLK